VSPRVFVLLLAVTAGAIWIGDTFASDFAAPGMQRTFAVLAIAAAIVAPVAWGLERFGYIRRGNVELGRKHAADRQRDGGQA
jgi:hypothetical protein